MAEKKVGQSKTSKLNNQFNHLSTHGSPRKTRGQANEKAPVAKKDQTRRKSVQFELPLCKADDSGGELSPTRSPNGHNEARRRHSVSAAQRTDFAPSRSILKNRVLSPPPYPMQNEDSSVESIHEVLESMRESVAEVERNIQRGSLNATLNNHVQCSSTFKAVFDDLDLSKNS